MNQAYQVWSVPQSLLRIEYSAELLRQVQVEGSGNGRGVLYGRRHDSQIRLLGARRGSHPKDPRLTGLEQVGVFAVRPRGDVFLTDEDLEFAERNGAAFTLVLAGSRGGFFVPEKDGSILAIRSHREFAVPRAATAKKVRFSRSWLNAVAVASCLVLAVAAALYAEPKATLTLSVHQEAGQLVAVWTPGVQGTLEIRNWERKIQIPVSMQETGATYQAGTGDVDFVLTTLDGVIREEHIRVIDSPRREAKPLKEQIEKLEAEKTRLIAEADANRAKLAQLEKILAR